MGLVATTASLLLLRAQDSGTPAAPAAPKPFQYNLEFDGYGAKNYNNPDSGFNALRAFDLHSNTFRVGTAGADLDYKTERFGAHLTGGYGDLFRGLALTEPALQGANAYLSQFYVSYKPLKGSGLQFDAGKFYTSVGGEPTDTQVNFNYSRSLLFALGSPYYHFGIRATIPITKSFSVSPQLLNGWNNLVDNNKGKTFGLATTLTRSRWGWAQTYMVGAEKNRTNAGKRQLIDEVVTFSPHRSVQTYAELLYVRDKRAGADSGADAWYGVAVASRWSATKKLSFSPRFEYYVDQTGFTSGLPQHLREVTGTAEYKLHPLVMTRLEFREDFSNQRYFETGQDGKRRQQSTLTLAVLFAFKGER